TSVGLRRAGWNAGDPRAFAASSGEGRHVTEPQAGSGWREVMPARSERDVAGEQLDETDRELLELSDGETSVDTMLLVLGLSEVDVLRRLRRLYASGELVGTAAI